MQLRINQIIYIDKVKYEKQESVLCIKQKLSSERSKLQKKIIYPCSYLTNNQLLFCYFNADFMS